jgi:hypothetical protein
MRSYVNIKRIAYNILLCAVCALCAIGAARLSHHATKGFCLSKVRSNLLEETSLASVEEKDKQFLAELFGQKFRFLGRGLQSFVFESEDGKYVLKLFNNRYPRNVRLFSWLSRLPLVGDWAEERAGYFAKQLTKTFQSYEIAFEEMQEKTGLSYIHLKPTEALPNKLVILDPLNIAHEINPNEFGFLIQKKATLVYPALKTYLKSNDLEGTKQALASLIDLFFWKWEQGIADNDPLIRTNYGFIEGKALQIDVGPLSKQAILPQEQKAQIQKISSSLRHWLTENAPELTTFLDQELQKHLSSEE